MNNDFVELSLSKFIIAFPEMVSAIVSSGIDVSDSNYIVRFNDSSIEIGYPSDNWILA